jgi:hypothetical protein
VRQSTSARFWYPRIADLRGIALANAAIFLLDICPNFVNLQMSGMKVSRKWPENAKIPRIKGALGAPLIYGFPAFFCAPWWSSDLY